jgi:hypothetical protein
VRDRIVARITDGWIEADAIYGTNAGREIQLVMQDILTAHTSPALTLWTPGAPGFAVTKYSQSAGPVLDALQQLVALIGWDLRPRWRASASAWQLALTEPQRSGASSVWTFFASEIDQYGQVAASIEDVRNVVEVVYTDGTLTSGGQLQTMRVLRTDAASVAVYGRRYFGLTEGSSSQIDSLGEAEALADAILADLSQPAIAVTADVALLWWLELNDVVTLPADGERFGAAQELAVVGLRHRVNSGGEATTTLQFYGQPRMGRRNWLEREARPGVAPSTPSRDPAQPLPPDLLTHAQIVEIFANWPATQGFDSIELHRSGTSGFTPSAATLVQLSRSRQMVALLPPDELSYFKVVITDGFGNRSAPSEESIASPAFVPAPALAPALRAVVQVERITSDQTIAASGSTVQLNSEVLDPENVWNGGSFWLIPLATGIYRLTLDALMSFDAATTYELYLDEDGASPVWTSGTRAAVTERYAVTTLVSLTAGAKYLLKLNRDAGTAYVEIGSKLIIEPTTAIEADIPPTLTAAAAISGTVEEGEVLTCSSGTWSASPAATYTRQWLRDAVAISSATSATYTLTADDVGALIACRVTATNRAGVASTVAARVGPVTLPVAALLLESFDALLLESGGRVLVESGGSMAISGLSAAASLAGDELVPIVQSGSTVTVTTAQLAAWIAGEI